MTKPEAAEIMAILQVAYPSFYRNVSQADAAAAVSLWADEFHDESFEVVAAAVKTLIKTRTEGYPPTIGEVAAMVQKLTTAPTMTEMEAWLLVEKACRNSLYNSREEFAKLPPIVQKAVGSHNQLREWALMDADTVKSVVSSNFMRSFKIYQKRERDDAMIPPEIKQMMSKLADQMALSAMSDRPKQIEAQKPNQTPNVKKASLIPTLAEIFPGQAYTPPTDEEFEKMREKALQDFREAK